VGEDTSRETLRAFGIADGVDLDDPAVADGEAHDRDGTFWRRDDDAGSGVDQGGKHQGAGQRSAAGLSGDGLPTAYHGRPARSTGAEVRSQHDVRIEQSDKGIEVTGVAGSEEGVDDGPVASDVTFRGRSLGTTDPTPRSARQLPGSWHGSSYEGGDLLEGEVEHVVEDECHALGR
jgi:hypothetical protein